jgi:TetR/AcrR family transcriptional regulator, regulator of autoinduction and epiphytic fitness
VNIRSPLPAQRDDSRRADLLDAAVSVFARFGFRKTSMDDVARTAGVSRQGLYLLFTNKEELFRQALEHSLSAQLSSAIASLSRAEDDLEKRLIAACMEWCGRFVGSLGADASDLLCASTALAGATVARYEARFEAALTSALLASPLAPLCAAADLAPADLARSLHGAARGLKQTCNTRQEFAATTAAIVRMICLPLKLRNKLKRPYS